MSSQGFTACPPRGAVLWRVLVFVASVVGACSLGSVGVANAAQQPAAGRLSAAEHRAIRIASVSAVGDDALGVIVSVRFRGDIERYLGQGNLTQGAVALVLRPAFGGGAASGIVDEGGGYTPVPVPILARHGNAVIVKPGAVHALGPERVVRLPRPGQQSVFRAGNQAIFYLPALGLARQMNVQVRVFAQNPAASGRSGLPGVTAAGWRNILRTKPDAVASTSVIPSHPSLGQLAALRSQVAGGLLASLSAELRREQRAHAGLRPMIAGRAATPGPLGVSRSALITAFTQSAAGIRRLQSRIKASRKLIAHIDALIRATSDPPIAVVQTDPGLGQALTSQPGLVTSAIRPQGVPVVNVNDRVRYQRFSGLGAALPDSSAWLINNNLSATNRAALLQALFGAPGVQNALGVPPIHLNFLRVPIAAGGAMTVGAPYSYDDNPPGGSDTNLAFFSIAHDLPYIVPTLQQALHIDPNLQILANPWSPPAWMKRNNSLDNWGSQGALLPSDYGPLANYFVKFIQAYASYGIPISAITPQNEPSSGQFGTGYPGMTLPEPNEAQFIAQDLAPALRAAGLSPRIYGNDLSWDSTPYANALVADPAAGPDLTGIAWHCYYGSPTVMSQLHQSRPALDQIVSECSPEIRAFGTAEFLISALRNWASTVSAWSVALDPGGGPIQPNNNCPGCRGPVTIDEATQTVSFRPEYYQLGQVSAFVQPGAIRIGSQNYVNYRTTVANMETITPGLDDVAFVNPDGSKVLIVYNNSSARLPFGVNWHGSYFTYMLPARAMTTFTWR